MQQSEDLTVKGSAVEGLAVCLICGQTHKVPEISPGSVARCIRCGQVIQHARRDSLTRILWLVVAALILYIPANLFPILSITRFGVYSENTILQGSVELYKNGYLGVALLVFLASIVIPLFKLLVLLYLSLSPRLAKHAKRSTELLLFIKRIGPWSMLDVFLVAILVALVKLGDLVTVRPEPGLAAFAAVVVLTTYASSLFEPGLLWPKQENSVYER